MTKIKNTKKGMAKKTLSMSLVVAMLATSNVPVWAAEFSDGSDAAVATEAQTAEAFSDETVEAPAVEDSTEIAEAEAANKDAITAKDLDVSGLTFKLDGNKELDGKATFGNTLTVGGEIKKTTDNTALQKFEFGYRIQGHVDSLLTGKVESCKVSTMGQGLYGDTWAPAVGQTIELYIFRKDDDAVIDNLVLATFTLEKKEVDGSINLLLNNQIPANNSIFKQTSDG